MRPGVRRAGVSCQGMYRGDFDQRTGKGVSLLSLFPTLCETWNKLPSSYSSYADAASVLQSCQFSFAVKPKTQRLESVLNH